MTNLTISMAKKLVGPTPPEMFPRGQLLMISAFYVFIFIAMRLLLWLLILLCSSIKICCQFTATQYPYLRR
jgi:hypothetical protein